MEHFGHIIKSEELSSCVWQNYSVCQNVTVWMSHVVQVFHRTTNLAKPHLHICPSIWWHANQMIHPSVVLVSCCRDEAACPAAVQKPARVPERAGPGRPGPPLQSPSNLPGCVQVPAPYPKDGVSLEHIKIPAGMHDISKHFGLPPVCSL